MLLVGARRFPVFVEVVEVGRGDRVFLGFDLVGDGAVLGRTVVGAVGVGRVWMVLAVLIVTRGVGAVWF